VKPCPVPSRVKSHGHSSAHGEGNQRRQLWEPKRAAKANAAMTAASGEWTLARQRETDNGSPYALCNGEAPTESNEAEPQGHRPEREQGNRLVLVAD
jgi:hypothetical protein